MASAISRRAFSGGLATALAATSVPRAARAAVSASSVTPQLIEAAKKEGKAVWYTAVDLPVAEHIAKAFEANIPALPFASTLGRRTHLSAHRSGVRQQHPCRRRRQ